MAAPHDRASWDEPLDHLRAEMERIDLLVLLVRIQVCRARRGAGDDAFRGLAISGGDIDAVFLRPLGAPHWTAATPPAPASDDLAHLEHVLAQRTAELAHRRAHSASHGPASRLLSLARDFALGNFDADLLCLGPAFGWRSGRGVSALAKARWSLTWRALVCSRNLAGRLPAS